jgi:hypothetical protein
LPVTDAGMSLRWDRSELRKWRLMGEQMSAKLDLDGHSSCMLIPGQFKTSATFVRPR